MSIETTTDTIKESNEQNTAPVIDPVEPVTEVTIKKKIEEKLNEDLNPSTPSDTIKENKELEPPVFSREAVEAIGSRVRLVDKDEENGLDLFCYVKCTSTDSNFIRNCRGVVFHGTDVVMKAFPYTIEYNDEEIDTISPQVQDFENCSFYDSHEGALIRLFYFGDKWYISTHRKLNAFRSKWASKESFGMSFKKALESEYENNTQLREALPEGDNLLDRFYTLLDIKKQYMFLVRNTVDNRIVCDPPERATLFHVGTFINGDLSLDKEDKINIPMPKKHTFRDVNEVISYVSNINFKYLQGVIVFAPNNVQFKIINKCYQDLFKARGNEPSIKFRYLQVRMNKKLVRMLYDLYPEQADIFDEYENTLYDIARSIYRAYVQRFIKKRYVTVPREEFKIIRDCHTWHLSERTENRISIQQVITVMNQQSPTDLNHMIRRFRAEQIRKKEQETITNTPNRNRSNSNSSISESPAIISAGSSPQTISPLIIGRNGPGVPRGNNQQSSTYKRTATINTKFPKPRLLKTENDNSANLTDFPPL